MKKILLPLLLFLIALSSGLSAKEYFVSKNGNDQHAGTSNAPFLTISKAASLMMAGDVCYIKEGIYRETLKPTNHGQEGNPIIFKVYEQDEVVISATEEIGNWSLHQGHIFKANKNLTLGVERNLLYYNRSPLEIARWPNNEDNDQFTFDSDEVDAGSGSHIESDNIPNLDWSGGYICYLGAHSGMTWTRRVTSSSAGRVHFTAVDITKWPFNPHNPTVYRNHNRGRYFLFGKLDALDYPGEWFYDETTQTVYCYLPGNENPSNVNMEVAARMNTMELAKNYIHVDGLTVFGGEVKISGNHCVIKNCKVQHCMESLDELNNTDAQIPSGAIKVEGSNVIIERNLIEYGSGNGISMLTAWKGSRDLTVRNNIVRHFNVIGIHANPIRSNCPGTIIQNNTIYSCGRDGIYVSGANSEISYNDVYDCMKINNDGGVFYTVGNESLKNSKIHHNWFHDSYGPEYADGRAAGIYLDNHSKGYDVHHNVVWNITWNALQINWENHDIDFFHNSFWNTGGAVGRWANGFNIQNVKVYNNYSDVGDWIGTDIQSNVINTTSPFVSIDDKNFMPATGSAIIDNGLVLAGVNDGYQGNGPDIGAYEFGGQQWKAGADWLPDNGANTGVEFFGSGAKNHVLNVFPNPASEDIYISSEMILQDDADVCIYSIDGVLVHFERISGMDAWGAGVRLNNKKLTKGTYLIKAISKEITLVGKVVVK